MLIIPLDQLTFMYMYTYMYMCMYIHMHVHVHMYIYMYMYMYIYMHTCTLCWLRGPPATTHLLQPVQQMWLCLAQPVVHVFMASLMRCDCCLPTGIGLPCMGWIMCCWQFQDFLFFQSFLLFSYMLNPLYRSMCTCV